MSIEDLSWMIIAEKTYLQLHNNKILVKLEENLSSSRTSIIQNLLLKV
jgi:hypothetical protein